jgi:DNA replication protein DnaC
LPEGWRSVAVECRCRRRARIAAFAARLPPEYRRWNLARLRPNAARHPLQAEIIPYLKANPEQSFLLCGKNRVGKSLFGWCLARHALLTGRAVVTCNLSDLFDEYREIERYEGEENCPQARITSRALEVEGAKYTLLLQEFDKPRITEYAAEKLFALIDAAYNYRHQLIVTSNLSVDDLEGHWSRFGLRYGRGIVSRITERCVEVNLF